MKRRIPALLIASLLAASCVKTAEEGEEADASPAASGAADASSEEGAPPESLGGTAWRADAEDGARFVTYLDEDGSYRDLRNGDAYQTGSWTYAEGARGMMLCFTPEEEAGIETCWEPGRREEDKMIVTGPDGKRVELTSVGYVAAETEEGGDQ